MSDKVVSIRMPKPLIIKIKEFSTQNDYLDSSEFIRSVMRRKYIQNKGKLS